MSFYKQHRDILDSDIIHLRRADGMDWDGIMHVNPQLKEKGFISLYNPLDVAIKRTINVPLYYTGLVKKAVVKPFGKKGKTYRLNRDYSIDLEIEIAPKGYTWYVIE